MQPANVDNWSWNVDKKAKEVTLCDKNKDKATFPRKLSCCASGIVGTQALESKTHYWEVTVSNEMPATTLLGICTAGAEADLTTLMCARDIMMNEECWMLLSSGMLRQDGKLRRFKGFHDKQDTVVGMLLNRTQGTLSYFVDGVPLGVAFRGIQNVAQPLYPIVASSHCTEITLGTRISNSSGSLQDRCRTAIMDQLSSKADVQYLPIPTITKEYLQEL